VIEERLLELIRAALETAAGELGFEGRLPEPELTPTKKKEHGDFATNVALVLASTAGTNPRQVAEAVRSAFPEAPFVERVEVAGPGFLNIFVTDGWLYDALRDVVAKARRTEPVNLSASACRWSSSAPTDRTAARGHARNAVSAMPSFACSSTRAGAWSASTTTTAGGQMDRFGASVEARYLAAAGSRRADPRGRLHGSRIDAGPRVARTGRTAYVDMPPDERSAGQAGGG
jgi:arginyl-tRNA synthetase